MENNYCTTEYGVNPGSPSNYSGSVNEWDCGCVSASGGYKKLCSSHSELPPVLRREAPAFDIKKCPGLRS
jgi:hypothetical protein